MQLIIKMINKKLEEQTLTEEAAAGAPHNITHRPQKVKPSNLFPAVFYFIFVWLLLYQKLV